MRRKIKVKVKQNKMLKERFIKLNLIEEQKYIIK